MHVKMLGQYERAQAHEGITGNESIRNMWRGINLSIGVFFLLAAYANANDADWYLWVPIYVIPSLLCLVVAAKPDFSDTGIWNLVCVLHFALCLGYAVYQGAILIDVLAGQAVNPLQHEEGREMGGLFIVLTWLGISRFTNLSKTNAPATNRSLMSTLILITLTLAVLPLFLWSLCFVSDWNTKLGHCNGMFT